MTKVAGRWLAARDLQAVMGALEDAGHQAFVVGGCVRNALLDKLVNDVDIATDAPPDIVTEIERQAGFTVHPTGIDHGTVTVATGTGTYEVTTFRKDVETDGRRAVVAFARTIEEDALRRDLTMNALYARRDGTVVDPLGGLPDLQARRVRFIEDADQRIREDYLRILRFFRFFAHYGDSQAGLDPVGLAACAAHVEGIASLSKERIGAEMLKLLAAPNPAPAVAAMEASGCLVQVLPGATSEPLAPLIHLEHRVRHDPIRRLAALGGQNVRDDLRLSNADARDRTAIRAGALAGSNPAELAYRIGPARAMDAMLVRHALLSQPLPKTLDDEIKLGAQAKFPVKAADLEDLTGKELGDRLRKLEADWVASGFTLTKDALLNPSM